MAIAAGVVRGTAAGATAAGEAREEREEATEHCFFEPPNKEEVSNRLDLSQRK
ncbi:hypothetical protein [Granulicella paludicola]|uniref:hypothetical protein n=1 Tax=Granulicella paludicola TaxID=474951 RepID=UPI0021DF90A7|nr:hypothetical protein [Granulicella paludicola]